VEEVAEVVAGAVVEDVVWRESCW